MVLPFGAGSIRIEEESGVRGIDALIDNAFIQLPGAKGADVIVTVEAALIGDLDVSKIIKDGNVQGCAFEVNTCVEA
jgi:hypothetical protein